MSNIHVYKSIEVYKIQKSHQCWECGEKISKGQPMTKNVGTYDGHFINMYICNACTKEPGVNEDPLSYGKSKLNWFQKLIIKLQS